MSEPVSAMPISPESIQPERISPTPQVIAEVVAAVESAYGVEPRNLRVYKGEFDLNIRFDDPEWGTWLIKVSSTSTGEDTIHWQEALLDAAASDPKVPFRTPILMAAADGRKHVSVRLGDTADSTVFARVVSWIPGPLMSERAETGDFDPDLLRSLGAAAAHLGRALSTVTMPDGIRQHEWMIHRGPEVVLGAAAQLGENRHTEIVTCIARRFEDTVLSRLNDLPWSVIHHDLHDSNVVVDGTGTSVAGVIDFNDAVRAPRICDLAITGAYSMLRQTDPVSAFHQVVDGYRSLAEPTPAELEVVGDLALMRLCMNWAQWQSRALESEDNEYALARSRHTWPLIERFAEVGAPAAAD